ncbi:MAG: aminoacyl-tRNA hydrolase [Sedimentisphaerales bacterium]|nr:aminoacyl-tRNA hydrolase [Sedimentisphaerales bacterium]
MGDMKIVVGLGNPGDEYINTRHNMGFNVIDSLAKELATDVKKRKFGARLGSAEFTDKKLILLKPWQYMNRSGQAVATAVGFYRLDKQDLMVITDDMDLEAGRIRIRSKGSAGGHNGLADIIEKLGTNEFCRCRIGIGRSSEEEAVDHVLDKPTKEEEPLLAEAIEKAKKAVLFWIAHGPDKTMNEFNRSEDKSSRPESE